MKLLQLSKLALNNMVKEKPRTYDHARVEAWKAGYRAGYRFANREIDKRVYYNLLSNMGTEILCGSLGDVEMFIDAELTGLKPEDAAKVKFTVIPVSMSEPEFMEIHDSQQ